MNERSRKLGKLACAVVCAAMLAAAALPVVNVHAEDIYPGEYSVTVVPTYQNPDTGAIDDVGQNPGIGNMMVQAQVQSAGYVEIEEDGTIWLNTRWNQADANIYAQFQTSSDGSQSWTSRDFEVTNQVEAGTYEYAGNTFEATVTDYRFQLGSLNDTIRCTNYVEAMQREVIWFCYITDLREGVDSSWTTITPPDMSQYTEELSQIEGTQEQTEEGSEGSSESSGTSGQSSGSSSSSGTKDSKTTKDKSSKSGDKKTEALKDRKVAEAKTNEGSGKVTSGKGLDDSTGIVGADDSSSDSEKSGSGVSTAGVVAAAVIGILVGAVIVGGIFYGVSRKKKTGKDLFPDVDDSDALTDEQKETGEPKNTEDSDTKDGDSQEQENE